MAAWEVAKNVGGDDLAGTYSGGGTATIGIGGTSGDARISQDYDHLYVTFINRNGYSAYFQYQSVELNADLNYEYSNTMNYMQKTTAWGGTSQAFSARDGTTDGIRAFRGVYSTSNSVLADTFGYVGFWLMDYTDASHYQTYLAECIVPNNSSTDSQFLASIAVGVFHESEGITYIEFKPGGLGGEYMTGTSYVVYGITGV